MNTEPLQFLDENNEDPFSPDSALSRLCLRLAGPDAGPQQRHVWQPERHAPKPSLPAHDATGSDITNAGAGLRGHCDLRPRLQLR